MIIAKEKPKTKHPRDQSGYWYHCTQAYRGLHWPVSPRTPVNCGNEPGTPRLCVGPSVAACFCSRLFRRDVWVYRSLNRIDPIEPIGVGDARITGERWYTHSAMLQFVSFVPAGVVRRSSERLWRWIMRHKTICSHRHRIIHYRDTVRVLKRYEPWFVSEWDREFSAGLMELLRDPEFGR